MASRATQLYRSLLKAHKKCLPTEMKELGDAYVKSEFKLHKTAQPEQVERFYTEWSDYLQQILATSRAKDVAQTISGSENDDFSMNRPLFQYGKDLPHDLQLTDEQVAQLEKLKEETTQQR